MDSMMALFDRIVDKTLLVRRVTIVAGRVISEQDMRKENAVEQMSLFVDYEELAQKQQSLQREKQMQKAMLSIQKKYGKNAVLKGTNLQEGATTRERNLQIGGHKG
jgi:DNA polymerase V